MATREEKIETYAQAILEEIGHKKVHNELLEGIVKHLGSAVHDADAELVAGTDPSEVKTIKDNFLKDKLELDNVSEEKLDEAIDEAIELYGRSHKRKYRAIIYYLLAQKFKKEHLFV
ncbi:MAG: DUF2853 family protein [Candidatus Nanoarchaeia archaeon]